MKWEEQGAGGVDRYRVVPRALCFLLHESEVLLLRGAPHKRLWAGKWNGIGGHIERDESILEGARREVREETGLDVPALHLRAVVHVSGREDSSGVLFFVFVGQAPSRQVRASTEGELAWFPLDALPSDHLVEDLPLLLSRVLSPGDLVYGRYAADQQGGVTFEFSPA